MCHFSQSRLHDPCGAGNAALAQEVEVVHQRNVQALTCQVNHDEGGAFALGELGQVGLAGLLIQGALDVDAAHPGIRVASLQLCQQTPGQVASLQSGFVRKGIHPN